MSSVVVFGVVCGVVCGVPVVWSVEVVVCGIGSVVVVVVVVVVDSVVLLRGVVFVIWHMSSHAEFSDSSVGRRPKRSNTLSTLTTPESTSPGLKRKMMSTTTTGDDEKENQMFRAVAQEDLTDSTTTTTESTTLIRQWSRGTLRNSLTKPGPVVTPPRTPKIATPPRTPKSNEASTPATPKTSNASPREKGESTPNSNNTPPKRLTKSYSTSNTKHRSDSLPTSHQKFTQTDSPTSPNRVRSISAKKQRPARMDKEPLDDQPKKASSQEAKCAEPCKKLKTTHALPYIELCVAVSKIRISKHQ